MPVFVSDPPVDTAIPDKPELFSPRETSGASISSHLCRELSRVMNISAAGIMQTGLSTLSGVDTLAMLKRFLAQQKHKCEEMTRNIGKILSAEPDKDPRRNDSLTLPRCPPYFDGLLCWPRTHALKTASLPCPPNLVPNYGAQTVKDSLLPNARAIVTKTCLEDGQWFDNSEKDSASNYSCKSYFGTTAQHLLKAIGSEMESSSLNGKPDTTLLNKWLPIIRTTSQIGYTCSLAMLVVAILVFSVLKKLRSPRNRLHMHLFASFVMRAFMALLKDWIFVDGVGLAWELVVVDGKDVFIKEKNTWICKAITSFWQYFIVANYSWILMEGLYLHNLVFLTFCADTAAITIYILLGWGLPALVVIPWIIIRATVEDTLCWTTHKNPSFFLVIRIPIMISILFNFLLFINIVRVLFIKFKTSVYLQRKKMQYCRWAKSTLVLVPLFGAHYTLFLGLSYHKDHRVELIWLFCDQLFASFQGSFVALLYCLLNCEVRTEMKRAWLARWSKRKTSIPNSARHPRKRDPNARVSQNFEFLHSETPSRNLSVIDAVNTL